MVVRRERKRKRYLGSRTRGAGNTENRRGKGSHGGAGKAGKWGHNKSKWLSEIGTKITQKPLHSSKSITLAVLSDYITNNYSGKKEPFEVDFRADLGLKKYTKVVAKGNFEHKAVLKNVTASAKAKEIVEKKGGSFK